MNYEFKGTGGNWYIVKYRDDVPEFAIESDVDDFATDGRICSHKFWSEGFRAESFANAHLIAAAPELLQACIELETILSPLTNNPAHASTMYRLYNAIHKALNISEP